MSNKSIKINLIKGVKIISSKNEIDKNNEEIITEDGVQTFVGTIKMKDLINNFEIPIYDNVSNEGYQREPKEARLNAVKTRIKRDYQDPILFADSINLNLRYSINNDSLKKLLTPIDKNQTGEGSFYTFTYDPTVLNEKFQIVDGQTRIIGTERAINDAKQFSSQSLYNQLLNINVNFNLTFTLHKYEEALQFYLINTHAKSIPVEGAHRLLLNAYSDKDKKFILEIENDKKVEKEMNYGKVTDLLLNSNSIWSNKIRNYNETAKDSGKRTTVTIKAMSTNLVKHVYEEIALNTTPENIDKIDKVSYEVIIAFWAGLKAAYNECDDISSNIMKSSQAEVIFKLNASIIKYFYNNEKFRNKFKNIRDPKNYMVVLKEFFKIVEDTNPNGKVKGTQCWNVGATGSMGFHTSASSKKNIFLVLDETLRRAIRNEHGITL